MKTYEYCNNCKKKTHHIDKACRVCGNSAEAHSSIKVQLGKQIQSLRKQCGVSTYELEQKGIHPNLPKTIEGGEKGYSIDSLVKYLNAIDETLILSVGKKEKKKIESTEASV